MRIIKFALHSRRRFILAMDATVSHWVNTIGLTAKFPMPIRHIDDLPEEKLAGKR